MTRRRVLFWFVVALTAGSVALTLVVRPLDDTYDRLKVVAPWIGSALLVGEIGWIGGALMMLVAVGDRNVRVWQVRAHSQGIAARANGSRVFRVGFGINLGSALLQFAVPAAVVCWYMPVHSWGVLSISALDLIATLSVRRIVWNAMKTSGDARSHPAPAPRPSAEEHTPTPTTATLGDNGIHARA